MAIDHTLLRMFMKMQDRHGMSGKLLTIGVQDVMFSHEDAEEFFRKENYKFTPIPMAERTYRKSKAQTIYESIFNVKNPMHMHDLFRMMNFTEVASLDAFDADSPTILHDMNKPIPQQYVGKYDVVFDIGSMEHVFDVKSFVANCIAMTREGGTLVIYDALMGWHNECFYNFQTPFFFDVFKANGFEDIAVYLNYFPKYHDFGDRKTTWLRFEYGDRVRFRKPNYNTHVIFVSKRVKALPEFKVPMQGYYAEYYKDFESYQAAQGGQAATPEAAPAMSHYMLENMPGIVRSMFPVLVPIYRALPNCIRTPAVDFLIYVKNRKKNAAREKIYC